MIDRYPITTRVVLFVLVPLMLVVLFVYVNLKSSIAAKSGDISITGISAAVEIHHDSYGTPTIVAKSDLDAYFALGFKHASDRMWQLELQRRISQGRLSEILGARTLAQDIWMRTLGLHEAAKRSTEFLHEDTIDVLTAYTNGINAWIDQTSNLPIEYKIFGFSPDHWTIYDTLTWQKVFSYSLSGNMFDEIQRSLLLQFIDPDAIKYFYSNDPQKIISDTQAIAPNSILALRKTLHDYGIGYRNTGSNAWVVSGKYTDSGQAILANDPHQGLQLPAFWYAASLKGDRLDVTGMTLVGIPGVVFGRNPDIAWGGTSLMSDQQDLFVEKVSPSRPNQYLNGNDWKDFTFRKELIKIAPNFPAAFNKAYDPIEIVVRETDRGPVISDDRALGDQTISLRWAALDSKDKTIESFIRLQYASNWDQFRHALKDLKSPGLNFLFADREGNIGYQAAGKIPKRTHGVGVIPALTSEALDWNGYEVFEDMPTKFNPVVGYIVSANEKVGDSSKFSISHEWAEPARFNRITDLISLNIESGNPLDIKAMQKIQSDNLDLTALDLIPYLTQISGASDKEKEAIKILKSWDGEFSQNSVAASIFVTWSHFLKHALFDDILKSSWHQQQQNGVLTSSIEELNWTQLSVILNSNSHGWCKESEVTECYNEIHISLSQAISRLGKLTGSNDVIDWEWGKISGAELVHQPFGQVTGLSGLFSKKTQYSSSPNSVNVSNHQFDPEKGFIQSFGATFRQVMDLGSRGNHWYMVSSGQSGNVMSRNFDDMVDAFANNQLSRFNGAQSSTDALNLVPTDGK